MAELLAVAVDDDVAAAVRAAEERVVGRLDAGVADDIAGRVEGVAVVVGEHLLGDLADVADEVGGEAVAGIEAALLVEGFELGELVAVGGDEGLLVGCDVLLQRDGLVLGGDLVAAERGLDLIDGDVQALAIRGRSAFEVFDLLAQQIAGDRRIVVDEKAAFAVEDACRAGRAPGPCGCGWPRRASGSCRRPEPAAATDRARRTARISATRYWAA